MLCYTGACGAGPHDVAPAAAVLPVGPADLLLPRPAYRFTGPCCGTQPSRCQLQRRGQQVGLNVQSLLTK
jgi:hypothetical protein